MNGKNGLILGIAAFCGSFLAVPAAHADWTFLPESRHHQMMTYGLFSEEHSNLLLRTANQAWGALGASLALAEFTEWKYQPQLIFWGSANAGYRLKPDRSAVQTETIDARIGLNIELALAEDLRLSFGWMHESGHISDDVLDPALIGPNLGNESFPIRLVKDIGRSFRIGATLRPVPLTEPKIIVISANEFIEWFPWEISSDPRKAAPFISLGLEQYGKRHLGNTTNVLIGMAWGSHFDRPHTPQMRAVLGFYTGWDPRMKYFQFREYHSTFGYAGMMFDI